MNSLRQKLQSLVSKSPKLSSQRRRFTSLPILHSQPPRDYQNDAVVYAICDAFRAGSSWETLTAKFRNLDLHEPLVSAVLSELSGPTDARRALGFFHWSARQKGFDHSARTYGLAINALVRARMNIDAKALVESVLKKNNTGNYHGHFGKFEVVDSLMRSYGVSGSNPFVFDLLVQGYSKLRMVEEGFNVVRHLERHGFCLSLASFNSLLRVAQRSGNGGLVWRVYEHMVRVRVWANEQTVEILIACLCKEGKLVKRMETLERICGARVSPSMVANSSLVFGVLEQGRIEEGMALLKRMLMKNTVFDTIAYSLLLYAKIKLAGIAAAREVYEEMLKRGFRPNPFVYTLLIEAYCEDGLVEEAGRLVREMGEAGTELYDETYSFLVKGYARMGRLEESLGFCERMVEKGFLPSCSAFNELVRGLCGGGEAEKANAMLSLLLERGFVPDEATYGGLIDGYGERGDAGEVVKLFYEMESKSLRGSSAVFSTVVKSLCGAGKLEEADKYLRIMKKRSVGSDHDCLYEMLISCYVQKGDTKRALGIQEEMVLRRK